MISLEDKIRTLFKFLERNKLDEQQKNIVKYLITDTSLLNRSIFVRNVSIGENILVLAEQGSILKTRYIMVLGQNKKTNLVYKIAEGYRATEEDIREVIENSRKSFVPVDRAIQALRKHKGDLLIGLFFDTVSRIPRWYSDVIESNPYILKVNEITNEKELQKKKVIKKYIDLEIDLINLRTELDQALGEKDFERCRAISSKISDIEMKISRLRSEAVAKQG